MNEGRWKAISQKKKKKFFWHVYLFVGNKLLYGLVGWCVGGFGFISVLFMGKLMKLHKKNWDECVFLKQKQNTTTFHWWQRQILWQLRNCLHRETGYWIECNVRYTRYKLLLSGGKKSQPLNFGCYATGTSKCIQRVSEINWSRGLRSHRWFVSCLWTLHCMKRNLLRFYSHACGALVYVHNSMS